MFLVKRILNKIKNIYITIRYYFSDYLIVQKFKNYNSYLNKQLEKTTNKSKRDVWTEKNFYQKKTNAFINLFMKNEELLKKSTQALSIGSRVGNEVLAIKSYGPQCTGIDLEPYKDLVIKGDMHELPFKDSFFDFVFTNILDHSLYPKKFFQEVRRVLKINGYFLLHIYIGVDLDDYSTLNIVNENQIKKFAKDFKIIKIYETDKKSELYFGMNKEFLFQKIRK